MRKLFTLIFMAVASHICFAQQVSGDLLIVEAKKGNVGKVLTKEKFMSFSKVSITGELNVKDLEALSADGHLTHLDMSNACYVGEDLYYTEFNQNNKFLKCALTVNDNLKELQLFRLASFKKQPIPLQIEINGNAGNLMIHASRYTSLLLKPTSKNGEINVTIYEESGTSIPAYWKNLGDAEVDGLYLPTLSILDVCVTRFYYNRLHDLKSGYITLNSWKPNYDNDMLKNVTVLNKDCKLEGLKGSISLPLVKDIPDKCFTKSPELTEVQLPSVVSIGRMAFDNTQIKRFVFPSSLERMNGQVFGSAVETVEFEGNRAPSWNLSNNEAQSLTNICFVVPEGKYMYYSSGVWSYLKVREKGFNPECRINCQLPGTLSSFLTEEVKRNTDYLYISGTIYEHEVELVKQVRWLKNVDWSGATIVKLQDDEGSRDDDQDRLRREWESKIGDM